MLSIANHGEMQSKITVKCRFTLTKMAIIKKQKNKNKTQKISIGEGVKKLEPLCFLVGI